jgi:hypothetical protein
MERGARLCSGQSMLAPAESRMAMVPHPTCDGRRDPVATGLERPVLASPRRPSAYPPRFPRLTGIPESGPVYSNDVPRAAHEVRVQCFRRSC